MLLSGSDSLPAHAKDFRRFCSTDQIVLFIHNITPFEYLTT
jgi:hypothetical protein